MINIFTGRSTYLLSYDTAMNYVNPLNILSKKKKKNPGSENILTKNTDDVQIFSILRLNSILINIIFFFRVLTEVNCMLHPSSG